MTTFHSARWGTITVDEDSVIDAPIGLISFPNSKRFVILDDGSRKYLQAVDNPFLALPIIDGSFIFKTPSVIMALLGYQANAEPLLHILCIVDVKTTTFNMKAPILYSADHAKLVQVDLKDSGLSTQEPIYNVYSVHNDDHIDSARFKNKPLIRN